MSALEVVFVSEGNCPNCNSIRAVLSQVHHEYRHVELTEVDPGEPLGRSLVDEYGVRMLPALIIDGRLRLVGEINAKDIYHEIQKAKHCRQP
jgi:predicted DsbA family dithiol-disulfide isomerase